MSGLPYDSTPPPEDLARSSLLDRPLDDVVPGAASKADGMDVDPLDRPLDDYTPAVPEHVKSLMGRMSKGKVYLLEESPAVVVHNEERVRGDPRIAALAEQLDTQDPASWLEAATVGCATPLLPNALYVRSDLIQHLSTSKVFSWTTGLGATVMGIEWLNDTTLHLLFPSSAAALLSLSLLAKAGFDPSEGDDPLLERSAHSIPLSLLPTDSNDGKELLAPTSTNDGRRRKGRGAFASGMSADAAETVEALAEESGSSSRATGVEGWNLAPGVDPNARIAVRFGLEGDKGLRGEAKQSQWYKRHGRSAGKETSSSKREIYTREEQLSFSGRGDGEGREFAKRLGKNRERRGPYDREREGGRGGGGGGGRGGRTAEDLDRELENMRNGGGVDGLDNDDTPRREGARTGRGGERRPRRGKDDLDKELDDMFASRGQNVQT